MRQTVRRDSVFISYSRRDLSFVSALREALLKENQDIWIDWESIPPSQLWWDEIKKGILQANNFVIVISQNSMSSPICQMEIEYAILQGKRIIPVMYDNFDREVALINIAKRLLSSKQQATRDIWGDRQAHDLFDRNQKVIAEINYLSFREEQDFDEKFNNLIDVISTDYEHKNLHTSYQIRAEQWSQRNQDIGLLLIETELVDAEIWLTAAQYKDPLPTELQIEFIEVSRELENERKRRALRLQNITRISIVTVVLLIIVAIGTGLVTLNAVNNRNITITEIAQAQINIATLNIQSTQASITIDAANVQVTNSILTLESSNVQGTQAGEDIATANIEITQASEALAIVSTDASQANQRIIEVENTIVPATLNAVATSVQDAENFADSIQLAARAQDIYNNGQQSLGLLLALEASYIDTPSQTQRILSELAYQPGARQMFDYTDTILSVTFSPDGTQILSGGYDGKIILWDIATGDIIHRFEEHSLTVYSVAFSPDGTQILSGSLDNQLILWDVETGNIIHRLEEHISGVQSVAFNFDGTQMLSSSRDTLILWDVETGDIIRRFVGQEGLIWRVVFSPDGTQILSGTYDSTLILWDVATGNILQYFEEDSFYLNSLAFSPDGTQVLSGEDSTLILWDVDTGDIIRRFDDGPLGSINSVAFNPSGTKIISGASA